MPQFSSGDNSWDQGLNTLGSALFPDPSRVAMAGYYGAEQGRAIMQSRILQDELNARGELQPDLAAVDPSVASNPTSRSTAQAVMLRLNINPQQALAYPLSGLPPQQRDVGLTTVGIPAANTASGLAATLANQRAVQGIANIPSIYGTQTNAQITRETPTEYGGGYDPNTNTYTQPTYGTRTSVVGQPAPTAPATIGAQVTAGTTTPPTIRSDTSSTGWRYAPGGRYGGLEAPPPASTVATQTPGESSLSDTLINQALDALYPQQPNPGHLERSIPAVLSPQAAAAVRARYAIIMRNAPRTPPFDATTQALQDVANSGLLPQPHTMKTIGEGQYQVGTRKVWVLGAPGEKTGETDPDLFGSGRAAGAAPQRPQPPQQPGEQPSVSHSLTPPVPPPPPIPGVGGAQAAPAPTAPSSAPTAPTGRSATIMQGSDGKQYSDPRLAGARGFTDASGKYITLTPMGR